MLRPDRLLLAALVATAIALPVIAAPAPPCPDGATWHGHAPPHGDGYLCARTGADGGLVRHGWAVLHDPVSHAKIEACEYRDGVRHGRCTLYSPQGAPRERGTFEHGRRTGAWWFWSLPTPHGPRDSLRLPLGDTGAASERRADVEAFLRDLGASVDEAPALGEAILDYVDRDRERRQVCGEHLCVGPGRIPDEPLYVHLGPTPEQTRRDHKLLTTHATNLRKRVQAEQRAARAEAARQAREQAAAAAPDEPAERACCRYCDQGKPCGDSCIARSKTCHKGRGCAC